jgi:hypothetical protein
MRYQQQQASRKVEWYHTPYYPQNKDILLRHHSVNEFTAEIYKTFSIPCNNSYYRDNVLQACDNQRWLPTQYYEYMYQQ